MDLLELKEVSKRFGRTVILDHLTLSVVEGEILGIVGMNGSGKTTLLKLMVGYYPPTEGTLLYRGQPLKKMKRLLRQEVGFTAQESSFYPQLTVEENVHYFGSLYGLNTHEITDHAEHVLALLELLPSRHYLSEHLSGGMQRRLEMACSLMHNPSLLILDEPTEDLDPLLRRDILRFIRRINDLGTTVVITSHLLGDVEELCTRIAILHNNHIVKVGTVQELRKVFPQQEEIHLQTATGKYDVLLNDLQVKEFHLDGNRLVIYTANAPMMVHDILHVLENLQDKLVYLDIKRPSLQEIFEGETHRSWL